MGGSRNSTVTQIRMVSQLTTIIPESMSILASFMWLPDIPPFSKLPPLLPTTVHVLEETPHNTMTWLMLSQSGFLTAFFFFNWNQEGKKPSLSFLEKIWSWKLPVASWRNHSSSFSSSTSVLLSYIRQKQTSISLLLHKLIQVGFLSLGTKSVLINSVGGPN